jgi:dihydrofolate reductase
VLKDRRQIVVSRTQTRIRDDVIVAKSVVEALRKATRRPREEVFVIGGGEVYAQALPYVERLIVTHVDGVYACDTFFPEIDSTLWRETARRHEYSTSADLDYRISVYDRTAQAEPIPILEKVTS